MSHIYLLKRKLQKKKPTHHKLDIYWPSYLFPCFNHSLPLYSVYVYFSMLWPRECMEPERNRQQLDRNKTSDSWFVFVFLSIAGWISMTALGGTCSIEKSHTMYYCVTVLSRIGPCSLCSFHFIPSISRSMPCVSMCKYKSSVTNAQQQGKRFFAVVWRWPTPSTNQPRPPAVSGRWHPFPSFFFIS